MRVSRPKLDERERRGVDQRLQSSFLPLTFGQIVFRDDRSRAAMLDHRVQSVLRSVQLCKPGLDGGESTV
jgi:hypothetical protein